MSEPKDTSGKHVAIYIRVSSKSQETTSQEPDLRHWAAGCKDRVVYYRDQFTGKTMDRPGWNKLMKAVEEGKVSKIVCWKLDRLGRTCQGLVNLFSDLQKRKVGLESLTDKVDITNHLGRMVAGILASIAEWETELRRERIMAGLKAKRERGETWGGSEPGRYYKSNEDKDEQIIKLHEEGKSISAISRTTSLSRPTIYARLEKLKAKKELAKST